MFAAIGWSTLTGDKMYVAIGIETFVGRQNASLNWK